MEMKQGQLVMAFASQAEWDQWLAEHHQSSPGLWLKLAKKQTGIDTVTYPEAVETALCYGWIDSQKAAYDESFWLQRFSPRTPKSKWSKINRAKALELIADNRMKPSGLAAIEEARLDGRWDRAYDSPSNVTVPEDLQAELDRNPVAAEFFATLDRTNRYAVLYRLHDATKPETRARRIEQFVAMLNRREKLYP